MSPSLHRPIAGAAVVLGMAAAIGPVEPSPGAAADRRAVEKIEFAVVVRPAGERAARGLVRITAHRGVRVSITGLVIAADPQAAGTEIDVLVYERGDCVTDGLSNTIMSVKVGADGVARIRDADVDVPVRVLRRAKSLGVAGDWDGDGTDAIGACGSISGGRPYDAAHYVSSDHWSGPTDLGLVARAQRRRGGGARVVAVAAGLKASSRHGLGVSRRSCADLRRSDRPAAAIKRIGTARADAAGRAFFQERVANEGFARAGSMIIGQPEHPVVLTVCARLTSRRGG